MNDIDKEQLKIEIKHIFDSGANEIRIFEMVKLFIESRKAVNTLPMHNVSGISLEQLKLQKECYRDRKESNGKATAYGEAHTDEIREGVIDHLIALMNYR